jgi:hypothetical protein
MSARSEIVPEIRGRKAYFDSAHQVNELLLRAEKADIFAPQMVKEILEKKDWTQREIEEREKRIVEWAKKQWADRPD